MTYGRTITKTKKVSIVNETLNDGASIKGFDIAEVDNLTIDRSTETAVRIHNGQALVIKNSLVKNSNGDGIYLTRSHNSLLDNVRVEPPNNGTADCVQFAYENQDSNISKNAHIKGCILLQGAASKSYKGGLVCEKTDGYLVEQSFIQGKNFAFSSIGNHAVVRSCVFDYARLNDYSFGYGIGEQHHLEDHHVYDCVIRDANRGFSLSSFGDSKIIEDNIVGYQRRNIVLHDTIIQDCDIGFFADRAWTGKVYRVIFMRCKTPIANKGKATQTQAEQSFDQLMTNDGSFLCVKAPRLTMTSKGKAMVSAPFWSEEPDEVRYIWRENGIDVERAKGTSFIPKKDVETSCVVLARKGNNWMLSIAELPWKDDWTPRAYTEGYLPWQNRYIKL